MKILINGDFYTHPITGIGRFSTMVCNYIDELGTSIEFSIIIPKNCQNKPIFKRIKVIEHPFYVNRVFWQQIILPFYSKKDKMKVLDFSNSLPIFSHGFVVLHDIFYEVCKKEIKGFSEWLKGVYFRLMYRIVSKNAELIFTVSETSKKQIHDYLGISEDHIKVVYSGWEQYKNIEIDDSIFDTYTNLKKGNYYFSLGSLAKNKNLKWVLDYASKNPTQVFVITGKPLAFSSNNIQKENLENVFFTGYLPDGQVKSLMTNAKAFIFPSTYEGFGVPPMEALSTGVPVVVSDIPVLKEIYGNSVYYINPYNTNISIDEILKKNIVSADNVLEKFTYKNTTLELLKQLELFNEN